MIQIVMLMAALSAIGGGYAYHVSTVSKLESNIVQLEANNRTLKENQVQMEVAVKTAQESLAAAEANAKKSEAAMTALTQRNNELAREKANYMKIFKDHNLTRLARAKPGMIEKRINNGTAKVFRDLENDTKELMAADDNDAVTPELSVDAQVEVGEGNDASNTGTENNNSGEKSSAEDLPAAAPTGN